MNRCYYCFHEYHEEYDICPHCGNVKSDEPEEPIHLKPGTLLLNRYVIGMAVGSGGFGIIYTAWDQKLETVVAVKEFFASRLMTRAAGESQVIVSKKMSEEFDYRKGRFLAEARNMAKFGNHRSIPNVYEFFEANGTAYIVMELLKGEALNDYLHDNGEVVDEAFAVYVTNEVGKALLSLHEKGIIHRDVAPDNIYICTGSELRIKLLDLGAAKLADCPEDVIDIILKPGYSPAEQYDNTKTIGTWTDVYALGATLYRMLTGVKPDESTNRKINDTVVSPHEINEAISENLSNAVMKAIAVDTHMRFKTVDEFLKAVNGEKKVMTLAKERKLRKRRRFTGILASCLVTLFAGVLVFHAYRVKKGEEQLDDASVQVWFSVADGSAEEDAMNSIKNDFMGKYPNVEIELTAIPEKEYEDKLLAAAEAGTLPTLFESTGISESILSQAGNVDKVLESDMAKDCYFLEQYDSYYSEHKQIPIGFEVPMAVVITRGATSKEWNSDYYENLEKFGKNSEISFDDRYLDLLEKNDSPEGMRPREEFLNNEENKTAVLYSSTMVINEVRQELTEYSKEYVYPKGGKTVCKFNYEWSIGNGTKQEINAGEKLLSWMLGNVYQNTLMISKASDGQIPINKNAFLEKINQNNYAPIKEIYKDFVFER